MGCFHCGGTCPYCGNTPGGLWAARVEAMKAVIVKRMHEVEPCFVHKVPDTRCKECKHDLFMAALVDEATKKRGTP